MTRKREIVQTMAVLLRTDINHDYNNGTLRESRYTIIAIDLLEELEDEFNLDHRESLACYEYLIHKLKGSN